MKYYQHETRKGLYRILPNGARERLVDGEWYLVSGYTAPRILAKYVELSKKDVIKKVLHVG
jgi:hypothetical protein